jgi:hypothetical protein
VAASALGRVSRLSGASPLRAGGRVAASALGGVFCLLGGVLFFIHIFCLCAALPCHQALNELLRVIRGFLFIWVYVYVLGI